MNHSKITCILLPATLAACGADETKVHEAWPVSDEPVLVDPAASEQAIVGQEAVAPSRFRAPDGMVGDAPALSIDVRPVPAVELESTLPPASLSSLGTAARPTIPRDAGTADGELAPRQPSTHEALQVEVAPQIALDLPGSRACSSTDQCGHGELCRFTAVGEGHCVTAIAQDCQGSDVCVGGMGLSTMAVGEHGPGPRCKSSCPSLEGGHLEGACVDAGHGLNLCVPVCRYHDDGAHFDCVYDEARPISDVCTRDHARLRAAADALYTCLDARIEAALCRAPEVELAPQERQALSCVLTRAESGSCEAILGTGGCFGTDAPDRALQHMLSLIGQNLQLRISQPAR